MIAENRGFCCDGVAMAGKLTKPDFQKTLDPVPLTHRAIDSLQGRAGAYRVPDARCAGLPIRIAPSGLKTWDVAFRVRAAGLVRRLSLGAFPAVGLNAARQRATELVSAGKAARDLVKEEQVRKEAAAARISVGDLIAHYMRHRVRGKLRTADEIEIRLRRALAGHLASAADDLRRRNIRELLDVVAERGALRGGKAAAADRCHVPLGTGSRSSHQRPDCRSHWIFGRPKARSCLK